MDAPALELPVDDNKFDMQKEFERYIDELSNQGPRSRAKPAPDALRAVREELKKSLSDPVTELAQLANLPGLGPEYKQTRSPHYVMLHLGRDQKDGGNADRKLKRLERVYAGFYYWFALMGKPAKAPEKQLIVILPENGEKFRLLHRTLDSLPLINDGFYSNLDNVAILSKARARRPIRAVPDPRGRVREEPVHQ